jgi:hypothetical protein
MSSELINNMYEVILGKNTISKDASYDSVMSTNFPIDLTSTQLEGAIPSLCDIVGYDVPLSLTFMNEGAPKFVFNKDVMSVKFNMIL